MATQTAAQLKITWNVVSSASGYVLYRSGVTGPLAAVTGTNFTDSNLQPGTSYSYTVASADCGGDPASPQSGSVSGQTYPLPVVSVTASGSSATSSVTLSWTATDTGGPGIANYKVFRGSTLLTTTTATSYTDSGLANGYYTYTVTAYDTVGDTGSGSASASVYPAPTLTVSAAPASASSITVTWSATDTGGPGIKNYNVYRGGTLLTASPITTTSYTDTGLAAGTNYAYTVKAYDTVGDAGSGTASATTYPLPSVSVSASAVSDSSVSLSWTATDTGGPGIKNYNVYRAGTLLTASPITATTYTDTGLATNTSYTYTVTAYDTVGDSGSGSTSGNTYTNPTTSVSASPVSSSSILVSWTAADIGGPGVKNYNVYRGSTLLTSSPITATSYTDTGLATHTSYTYTVKAYDTAGDAGSGTATGTTYPLPTISVTAADVSYSTSVSLSWTASDSGGPGVKNYNVYRGSTLLTSSPITATSYTDTGSAGSTSYTYTVTVYDTAGDAGSGTASVTTLPPAPVLSTSATTVYPKASYTISWTSVAGSLNHYTLYLSTNLPSTATYTLSPSTLSQTRTNSGQGQSNTFTVRACLSADDSQCSAWSNAVVVALRPGGGTNVVITPPSN